MPTAIEVTGLEVHFPGCDALRGVDLSVAAGSVYALLGENGVGKTTLIRCLTGYQWPTAGQCRVLGLDPLKDAEAIRRRIGYVADPPALYAWMRVDEIGWFTSAFHAPGFLDRYRSLIARFELPANRKIGKLSKGQVAKVALALAIAPQPELLILDEPTAGLDPLVRQEFLQCMVDFAAAGGTVFLSSHQINEVERVADSIVILHQGKTRLSGHLEEVRKRIQMVTVTVAGDDPFEPVVQPPAKLLYQVAAGNQRRLFILDYTSDTHEDLLAIPSVLQASPQAATLDEIFLVATRGADFSFVPASQTSVTSTTN